MLIVTKLVGTSKTKGPQLDSQNQLRPPILEGGEPTLAKNI